MMVTRSTRCGGSKQALDRRGQGQAFASLLALILLAVMAALAVVFAAASNLSLRTSHSHNNATQARLLAESGLAYTLKTLQPLRLPGTTDEQTFAPNLSSALGEKLNGTPNLSGQPVTVSGSSVLVPPIAIGEGQFTTAVAWLDASTSQLTVAGSSQGASQRVRMHLALVSRRPSALDYGLASRGQILISGNARIVGVNSPEEASVVSATATHTDAIVLSGNSEVSGDVYASGDTAGVAMTGSPSVGGSTDPNVIAQHVHLGVEAPDCPEIDVTPIAVLATTELSESNPSGASYSNIRIAAGTNPTFGGEVTLNGVIYVEAPNVVRFGGQTTINGLIVTQASDYPLSDCQISFGGGVRAYGVEVLPDTPEFTEVKTLTGTFIAAPGFGLTFSGRFGAVNGSIAADQLTFAGTAEGVVRGSVLGLKDLPCSLGGNVEIYVDMLNADPHPAGFVPSLALVPIPATYVELKGGQP